MKANISFVNLIVYEYSLNGRKNEFEIIHSFV